MSVELSPSGQLGFARPFNQNVTRTLHIKNPHSTPIAVKLKTTSPRSYSVRPNSGRIEPGETLSVAVCLQRMEEEPPLTARSKDKFLIMSCVIPVEKEGAALSELWSEKEKAGKADVFEQKIRCVYVAASDTIDEGAGEANDSTFVGDQTLHDAIASPSHTHADLKNVSNAVGGLARPASDSSSAFVAPSSTTPANNKTATASPKDNLSTSDSTSSIIPRAQITNLGQQISQTVEEQLKAARQEITTLQNKIAESEKAGLQATGLRKRTTGGADTGLVSEKVVEKVTSPTGVSVQMVVVIAVAVAAVTYVFF